MTIDHVAPPQDLNGTPAPPGGVEQLRTTSVHRVPARQFRNSESQDGVTYRGGRVFGLEHNQDLTPLQWRGSRNRIGVVDKMVREDAVAQAIQLAVSLPLQAVSWEVVPASQDRDALADAAMVRAVLFERLAGGWASIVEFLASYSWRGFALAEIVAELDRDFRVDDGDGGTLFAGPALLPSCLAPLPTWTIKSWLPEGEPYRFGVQQYPNDGVGGEPIPADKLVHPVFRSSAGSNPEGWSILRPSYAPYMLRRTLTVLEVAGFDRSAFGTPYATIDDGVPDSDRAVVDQVLANLRSGARSFATLPNGVSLDFAEFPFKADHLREAKSAAGRDMARSCLAPWLFTGDNVGAYSLIAGQLDLWGTLIRGIIDEIPRAMNGVVRKIVDWNRRDVRAYPKLVAGPLNIGDPAKLIEAIIAAADATVLTPDAEIEDRVRDSLGLTPMPAETREAWAQRMRSGAEVGADDDDDDSSESGGKGTAAEPASGSEDDDDNRADQDERPESMSAHRCGPGCGHGRGEHLVALLAEAEETGADRPRTGPRGRALREHELVLRLSETAAPLVSAKEESAEAVAAWRKTTAEDYAAALVEAGNLRAMRTVPPPATADLTAELVRIYRRAYLAGAASLQMEVDRAAEARWTKAPEQGEAGADPRAEVALMESGLSTWDLVAELQRRGALGSLVPAGLDPDRDLDAQAGLWIYYRDKRDRSRLFDATGWGLTLRDIVSAEKRLRKANRDQEQLVSGVDLPSDGSPPPAPVPRRNHAEGEKRARRLVEDWRAQRAIPRPPGLPGDQEIDEVRPEALFAGLARTTAQRARQRVQEAALSEAQSRAVGGSVPSGDAAAVAAAIVGTIVALSLGVDRNQGQADANEAFSVGREQSGRAERFVEGWWFSNLLESQTCDPCASEDGRPVADHEIDEFSTPFRRCAGGSKCNCLLFARIRGLV